MNEPLVFTVQPRRIIPEPIPQVDSLRLEEYERGNVGGLNGCLGLVIWAVLWMVMGGVTRSGGWGILLATAAVAGLAWFIREQKVAEAEALKAQAQKGMVADRNRRQGEIAEQEAADLANRLVQLYNSAIATQDHLKRSLDYTSELLRHAEYEYRANAFSSFWDCVEKAAEQLADFSTRTRELSKLGAEYYRSLEGRQHTCTAFPVRQIPNPAPVSKEWRRIVRLGETNFHFANIWEHRRTRKVMILGFQNMAEAVDNLAGAVDGSVSDLRNSLTSKTAELAKEQIRLRDELTRRTGSK